MNGFLLDIESLLANDPSGSYRVDILSRLEAMENTLRGVMRQGGRPADYQRLEALATAVFSAREILMEQHGPTTMRRQS